MAVAILSSILLLLPLAFIAFLQKPQFGKTPSGERLARILASPNYRDGKFQNQSFTPVMTEGVTWWHMIGLLFRAQKDAEPKSPLPSVRTDLKNDPEGKPSIVWFGHSSYLIRTDGINILVDPVFSGRAAPVPFFGKSFKGSDVYTPADMPDIDILLLTHDHYDHLDYETIKALQPKVKRVVTSLGVGAHLEHWGYPAAMIAELDWQEYVAIVPALTIRAAPARHFSGRRFKRAQTLWSSFILQSPSAKIYIGGDSGYDEHFKEIGERFGPFDFALLECGQYFDYWKQIHAMPEEVAQIAVDIKAHAFMPVHWAKFNLAPHSWKEPVQRITKKAKEMGLVIATPQIGQKIVIGGDYPAGAGGRRLNEAGLLKDCLVCH